MSLEELICIETVQSSAANIELQATYSIINLRMSTLFEEVFKELEKDILPILETRILLHTLRNEPFSNELKGINLLDTLAVCMERQLYATHSKWNCKVMLKDLKKLQKLVLYEYEINGSLIIYDDGEIFWDVIISMILENQQIYDPLKRNMQFNTTFIQLLGAKQNHKRI